MFRMPLSFSQAPLKIFITTRNLIMSKKHIFLAIGLIPMLLQSNAYAEIVSLKENKNVCIIPQGGSPSEATEGTPLVLHYKNGPEDCSMRYHSIDFRGRGYYCYKNRPCNKNIIPQGGSEDPPNGTPVVISSSSEAQFDVRWSQSHAGYVIVHLPSNKCIRPLGGNISEGTPIVLDDICDTAFDFWSPPI